MTDGPPDALDRATRTRAAVSGALALVWGTLPGILGVTLVVSVADAEAFFTRFGDSAFLVYALGFAVLAGLGLLPTFAQAFAGGWILGFAHGAAGAGLGIGLAAILGYLVSRLVAGDAVRAWIDRNPRWKVVRESLVGRGFGRSLAVVTLVRFPPNSPFALCNLALASCGTRPLPYLVGTLVGMAPRTIFVAWLGSVAAASATDENGRMSLFAMAKDKPWMFAVGLASTIAVLVVLGQLAKHALRRAGLDSAR
jgi:uncharacterized membrane protein YdjX (TVP38/TMEM64 family)